MSHSDHTTHSACFTIHAADPLRCSDATIPKDLSVAPGLPRGSPFRYSNKKASSRIRTCAPRFVSWVFLRNNFRGNPLSERVFLLVLFMFLNSSPNSGVLGFKQLSQCHSALR
jgi:hypothetical protein